MPFNLDLADDIRTEQNYPGFITNFSARDTENYKAAIVEYYTQTGNMEGLYIDNAIPPMREPDGALFHENKCRDLRLFWKIYDTIKGDYNAF